MREDSHHLAEVVAMTKTDHQKISKHASAWIGSTVRLHLDSDMEDALAAYIDRQPSPKPDRPTAILRILADRLSSDGLIPVPPVGESSRLKV
jgi:hypothetical protein